MKVNVDFLVEVILPAAILSFFLAVLVAAMVIYW